MKNPFKRNRDIQWYDANIGIAIVCSEYLKSLAEKSHSVPAKLTEEGGVVVLDEKEWNDSLAAVSDVLYRYVKHEYYDPTCDEAPTRREVAEAMHWVADNFHDLWD